MGDSSPAVVAGLAVGVTFVMVFGLFLNNSLSNNTIHADSSMNEEPILISENISASKTTNLERLTKLWDRLDKFDANESSHVDMSRFERNDTEAMLQAERIDRALEDCERHYFSVGYGLGSMRVAIEGLEADNNTLCSVFLMYEIEMGGGFSDCSIPLKVMPLWQSWKNGLTPEVSEIVDYCATVGELNPIIP